MKHIKILLTCILVMVMGNAFAQLPAPGSNILRPDLNKFEGTWKWVDGTSEVTIQLKKLNYHFVSENYNEEIIVGSHKYIDNGSLVENYLPAFPTIGQNSLSTIFLYEDADAAFPNKISGALTDHRKHKKVTLKLEYVAGATPTLIWHMEVREDFITEPARLGKTLPVDLILTKQ